MRHFASFLQNNPKTILARRGGFCQAPDNQAM
jgi:hypothetical protein